MPFNLIKSYLILDCSKQIKHLQLISRWPEGMLLCLFSITDAMANSLALTQKTILITETIVL